MPAGTTLGEMIEMLREETGRSTNAAVGLQELPALRRALRRTQYMLWMEHDWPHLSCIGVEDPIEVGQDQYELPADIPFERINEVACFYNGDWTPVHYGIEFGHLNAYDPDQGETSAPIVRWEMDIGVGERGYRVWPMPNEAGMKLRFKGQRALSVFVADNHTCDLDDELIVLMAAANILERQGSKDAQSVRAAANRLLSRFKAGGVKSPVTYLAGGALGAKAAEPRRVLRGGRDTD